MSALRELLAIFDIRVDDKELKEGHKEVKSFQKSLEEIAKTVGEAFAVKEVYEFVESQVEAAAHIQDVADRLDVSATMLDDFGAVAKSAGLDFDSAARSLGFLEANLGKATEKGGDAAKPFQTLGVALKDAHGQARPLTDVLGDVAEGISKLPDQNRRAALSMEIFGREGRSLIPILAKGRDGVADLMKEAHELGNGLGDDYFENAKKAREESEKLGRAIQSIKERAIAVLLPYITDFVGLLKEASQWSLEHTKTTQALEYALAGLAVVIGIALVDALSTAAVEAWALVAPFVPIVAAIGLVVYAWQDLISLMEGGESVIGRVVELIGGVGAKEALITALNAAWVEMKGDIDQVAFALGYFTGLWVAFGKVLKTAVGNVGDLEFFRELKMLFGNANTSAQIFLATLNAIKETLLGMIPGLGLLRAAGTALGLAHGAPVSTDASKYGVPAEIAREEAARPQPGPLRGGYVGSQENAVARPRPAPGQTRAAQLDAGVASAFFPQLKQGDTHITVAPTIHQTIHTKSDKPKEVGDAATNGISTQTQRDLEAALYGVFSK